MKINVLGASGQLGGKVMRALLDQGAAPQDLIASARSLDKIADLAALGIELRYADYEKPDTLRQAFRDTDVLLLIPTLAPVEARVLQHAHAVDAARECGVGRIALASFIAAEPSSKFLIAPFMLYAESKLRLSGMAWTILRDGMYLDPLAEWAPALVDSGRLPYPVAQGRVAYISRQDLARALAAACLNAGHENRLYRLTGPAAISMPELAQALSQATGQTIRYEQVSEQAFADICRADNIPEPMVQVLISMYRAVDNGEFEQVTRDVEKLTGRPPQTVQDYLTQALG